MGYTFWWGTPWEGYCFVGGVPFCERTPLVGYRLPFGPLGQGRGEWGTLTGPGGVGHVIWQISQLFSRKKILFSPTG